MSLIAKRRGHTEEFDQKKLYASIYAACMVLRITHEQAELIAQAVTDEVKTHLESVQNPTTKQIHELTQDLLNKYQPDAALIYKTHLDLS